MSYDPVPSPTSVPCGIWNKNEKKKFGSLIRVGSIKRDKKLVQSFQEESKRTLPKDKEEHKSKLGRSDSLMLPDLDPEDYHLADGEERSYLDPAALKNEDVKELMSVLTNWINEVLALGITRMRVTNIEEDLHDGLVLSALFEQLTTEKMTLPMGEYVQAEERKVRNVKFVLDKIKTYLDLNDDQVRWSAEELVDKNILSTLRLVLCLSEKFADSGGTALLDLPKALKVTVIKVRREGSNTKFDVDTENLIRQGKKRKTIVTDKGGD